MYDTEALAAAVRQAAVNLTSAAAAVGRVLESVADAIAPETGTPAPTRRAAPRKAPVGGRTSTATSPRPRKKAASSKPTRSRSAPGKRTGRTTRGRSSPA